MSTKFQPPTSLHTGFVCLYGGAANEWLTCLVCSRAPSREQGVRPYPVRTRMWVQAVVTTTHAAASIRCCLRPRPVLRLPTSNSVNSSGGQSDGGGGISDPRNEAL